MKWLLLSLIALLPLSAKPKGFKPVSGRVTYQEKGSTTIIGSGKRAIIKWDEFSIGKDESVRFAQTDSKSVVLNRVRGNVKSELLGRLESNGQVYLINPKGVLIGKNATINVGAFIASTLDVLKEDFLKGEELFFSGDSKSRIVNLGKIEARSGDVSLFAHHVINRGEISAQKNVNIAAASSLLLKPKGSQHIFIETTLPEGRVEQEGKIAALTIELKSASLYEKAIHVKGEIEAGHVRREGGRIYLRASQGGCLVEGKLTAEAGRISIGGEEITLAAGSLLDVSSQEKAAGGIAIGDYESCKQVHVAEGAALHADGRPGGKIRILSSEKTEFSAEITARGLGECDGGWAEISSAKDLRPGGTPDFSSEKGRAGEILFDPGSITISSEPTGDANTFNDAQLSAWLEKSDITIDTANSTAGGMETVTFLGPVDIDWSSDKTLTVIAGDNIVTTGTATINNSYDSPTATPALHFSAGDSGITLSNLTIETVARDIEIETSGALECNSATLLSQTGNLHLLASGDIQLEQTLLSTEGNSRIQTDRDLLIGEGTRAFSQTAAVHIGRNCHIESNEIATEIFEKKNGFYKIKQELYLEDVQAKFFDLQGPVTLSFVPVVVEEALPPPIEVARTIPDVEELQEELGLTDTQAEHAQKFIHARLNSLGVAEAELQDRLPLFCHPHLPNYPWHHPSICSAEGCDPDFDGYNPF